MVIKQFSEDEKNFTLEFNEFLKMIADENKLKKMKNQDEIIEAFRYTSLTKVLLINSYMESYVTGFLIELEKDKDE